MSLRLRTSTWPNEIRHDDFQILEGEQAVGRLQLIHSPDGPRWSWTVYEPQSQVGPPPSGIALSRDQAMAAFEAAWKCLAKR